MAPIKENGGSEVGGSLVELFNGDLKSDKREQSEAAF